MHREARSAKPSPGLSGFNGRTLAGWRVLPGQVRRGQYLKALLGGELGVQ